MDTTTDSRLRPEAAGEARPGRRGVRPRPGGRPGASAAAALLAVALAATAGGCDEDRRTSRYEETSQVTLPLGSQTRIVVENARGTVRLRTSDTTLVRVEARKRTAARDQEAARALAGEVRVEVVREGTDLRLVVHYPERISSSSTSVRVLGKEMLRRRADVDLHLAIPRDRPVKVVTKSGDLTCEGSSGPLEFWTTSGDARVDAHTGSLVMHSTSGDLSMERLDGALEMETTSGDLSADLVTGALDFESTSGDLEVADVGGALAVSTVSGDVAAERARGAAAVSTTSGDVNLGSATGRLGVATASGDVDARVEGELQNISIETTSGGVSLGLPDPARGRLEVVTASGDIVARIPMTLEQANRRRLVGVLGPGAAVVSIHTASGDVLVGPAGER